MVSRVFRGARGFMPSKDSPYYILCIGDLHVGSAFGMLPPTWGGFTPAQEWLWTQWLAMRAWAKGAIGGAPFTVVPNGDILEGTKHPGEKTLDDLVSQCEAAETLLQPLCTDAVRSGGRVFVTRGTGAHNGNSRLEGMFSRLVGGEVCPSTGEHAPQYWRLRVYDTPIVVRHHSVRSGKAAGIQDLEELWLEHARGRNEIPEPVVLITSHLHTLGVQHDQRWGWAFRLPAWQLPTSYPHQRMPGKVMHATVGAVLLEIRPGGRLQYHRFERTMPLAEQVNLTFSAESGSNSRKRRGSPSKSRRGS